ncbi:YHYH protein [Flammeovirga agarivorans]|uniref:YHYH protein n=1 Tax=Flammeovirga agarivorans TaxID=2726742 RepID=A0A7X8SP14_9BACT|nr:YHYH protein [Flammeovirga agarivorans]NLR93683.1 YHYH protein [Flammeovirga agarivorans]
MKKYTLLFIVTLLIGIFSYSCSSTEDDATPSNNTTTNTSSDDDTSDEDATDETADENQSENDSTNTEEEEETPEFLIASEYFNQESLISIETVTATLEDGTTAECFEITFSANPVENDSPLCPETLEDVGGLGIYDGDTNPGFQVMKRALFEAMEQDGYDIVDDQGNIRIDDFQSGALEKNLSYCLDAAPDDDLELTYIIPKTPKLASSVNTIETVELIGVSIDGVPINGTPPSAISGPTNRIMASAKIPSLDRCGGHKDPAGYYHWHFIAEVMDRVLVANNITDINCGDYVDQLLGDATKLVGFAKDGYPIYAYAVEPDDLDECGGRSAITTEYPDGVYHYVASTTDAPNVPVCLKGVAVRSNNFRYE